MGDHIASSIHPHKSLCFGFRRINQGPATHLRQVLLWLQTFNLATWPFQAELTIGSMFSGNRQNESCASGRVTANSEVTRIWESPSGFAANVRQRDE
jgi:hypothetical protein